MIGCTTSSFLIPCWMGGLHDSKASEVRIVSLTFKFNVDEVASGTSSHRGYVVFCVTLMRRCRWNLLPHSEGVWWSKDPIPSYIKSFKDNKDSFLVRLIAENDSSNAIRWETERPCPMKHQFVLLHLLLLPFFLNKHFILNEKNKIMNLSLGTEI